MKNSLTVLTLIFITLKLLNKIDWSWWWVLSPSLIPLSFFLIGWIIGLLIIFLGKSNK